MTHPLIHLQHFMDPSMTQSKALMENAVVVCILAILQAVADHNLQ